MGSFAELYFSDFEILSTKNHLSEWIFKEKDKKIFERKLSDRIDSRYHDLKGTEDDENETAYIFESNVLTIKNRLENMGYSLAATKINFERMVQSKLKEIIEDYEDDDFYEDEKIFWETYGSFEKWEAAFKIIITERPDTVYSFSEPRKVHENALVNHMMNQGDEYYFGFNYPTEDFNFLARLLIEYFDDHCPVVLDATDLVYGGYYRGFNHIKNMFTEHTSFFYSFEENVQNLKHLLEIKTDKQQALNYLLYSNVITLLETYLSDVFISTVCNFLPLMRRLLESDPEFKNRKFDLSDIFSKYDNLHTDIQEYLSGLLYHNISKIKNLYESVLSISFPSDLVFLYKAVDVRHDLVHRNGKSKKGIKHKIGKTDVDNLLSSVITFITDIDLKIKDVYPSVLEDQEE